MRGMLRGMGASETEIVRLAAKDTREYDNNKEAICEAAIQDGFDFFEIILGRLGDFPKSAPGEFAWLWTYCRSLRFLMRDRKTTLLMIDDFTLRQTFWEFQYLVGSIDDPLKILQIESWLPHEEQIYKDIDVRPRNLRLYNNNLFHGLYGAGDSALIFTPAGAELMLEWITETADVKTRYVLFPEAALFRNSNTNIPGCFVVHCSWKWIGHTHDVFDQSRGFDSISSVEITDKEYDRLLDSPAFFRF